MKNCITSLIMVCALAIIASTVFAQKTQVSVQGGKVKVQTQAGSVTVNAGQKGILKESASPIVGVDDPMVEDLIQIDKWVEDEKAAGKLQIDSTVVTIASVESKNLCNGAALLEMPVYAYGRDANSVRLGDITILNDPKFYDMQGNVIPSELELVDPQLDPNVIMGYYHLQFQNPLPRDKGFKFIATVKNQPGKFSKEGPLWKLDGNFSGVNCLTYHKTILPKSAILVHCSRPPVNTETVDGRIAVTIRTYSGSTRDSKYSISFLWPDMDGTSLADLPSQYRGLEKSAE